MQTTHQRAFLHHTDWVNDLALCNNNKSRKSKSHTVLSCSSDQTINLWDIESLSAPNRVGKHSGTSTNNKRLHKTDCVSESKRLGRLRRTRSYHSFMGHCTAATKRPVMYLKSNLKTQSLPKMNQDLFTLSQRHQTGTPSHPAPPTKQSSSTTHVHPPHPPQTYAATPTQSVTFYSAMTVDGYAWY